MRLAIALLIAIALLGASIEAVGGSPEDPVPGSKPVRADWSEEKLDAFVQAVAAVTEVKAFVRQYARARRERTTAALVAQNQEAIRTAIREGGLTLSGFDAIQRAVQGDPRLHARVREIARHDGSVSPSGPVSKRHRVQKSPADGRQHRQ